MRSFSAARQIRHGYSWRRVLLPVIMVAAVAAVIYFGIGDIRAQTEEERLRSVERAVTRAVVQCYAIEGQYPASYAYLEENYGLMVDLDKYIVRIDFSGMGNIMPNIIVLPR
jgi:hypothetical protein